MRFIWRSDHAPFSENQVISLAVMPKSGKLCQKDRKRATMIYMAQILHNHIPPAQHHKIDIAQSTSRWMVQCDCAYAFAYENLLAQSHYTIQRFCAGGM